MTLRTFLVSGCEQYGFRVDGPIEPIPTCDWRLTEMDFLKLIATDPDPFNASAKYSCLNAIEMSQIVGDLNAKGVIDISDKRFKCSAITTRWEASIILDWNEPWIESAELVLWGILISGMLLEVKFGRMSEDIAEINFTPRFSGLVGHRTSNKDLLELVTDMVGIGHVDNPWIQGLRKRADELVRRHLLDLESLPQGIWWTPKVLRRCISTP